MIRRIFYAWHDPKKREFRLSLFPADAPVRPSLAFAEKDDLLEYAKKKRGQLMWWPPDVEEREPNPAQQRRI